MKKRKHVRRRRRHHIAAAPAHRRRRRHHMIADAPRRRARRRAPSKITMKKAAIQGSIAVVVGGVYPIGMIGIQKLVKNRFFAGLIYVGIAAIGGLMAGTIDPMKEALSVFTADMTVYFDVPKKVGFADYFADYFADPVHQTQLGAPSQTFLPTVRLGDVHNATLGDVARAGRQANAYAMNDNEMGDSYGTRYGT